MQKVVEVTAIFDWLCEAKARINFLVGGANSSKSYSIAQHLILNKLYSEHDKRILVVRKTTPSLRNSCYLLINDLLKNYGLPHELNKSDMLISAHGNTILFKGLDDPEKIKSSEYNYIWVEEGTELTLDDYIQLDLRLRRATDTINQMYWSLNPIDSLHWIKREVVDKPDSKVALNHSTYKDNPFASKEDIEVLENLIATDENFYRVYALGQWGILKNIIYSGWKALSSQDIDYNLPEEAKKDAKYHIKDISYGIDWGYENPCALTRIYWLDGYKFIAEEVIYQRGLTTPKFIELAKSILKPEELKQSFYAGTDEPNSIQSFYEAGFNIYKAITDVRDGINFCKSHLIGLIGSNIIKEAQGYKRMEDKDGNVKEEPVKVFDHAMDSMRYGTFSKIKSQLAKGKTASVSLR
jgi:phage terminase large subunit